MAGLDPAIHVFLARERQSRGCPGHRRAEATPSFRRLCPGMTIAICGGTLIFLRILDRLEEILIATLMALATVIIFIAVVHRYLLGVPFLFPILFPINLSWAQELCIYMFVWVAKFGAAYGVRTGIHVGVDVVV